MSSGYLPPMLIMVGLSYADKWRATNSPAAGIPILIEGGVATGLLALFNAIPGMSPVTTMIGWIALVAVAANSSVFTTALNTVQGK